MITPATILNYFQRDKRLLLHITLVLLCGFILLTLFVYILPSSFIDIEFSEEIQEDRNPLLNWIMRLVSWFGNGITPAIMAVLVASVFFIFRAKREGVFVLLSLLSGIVIYVLKIAVNRSRPTADLVMIVEEAQFNSFPSGHVTFYVVFFGFLVFLMYRLSWVNTWLRWGLSVLSLALIFSVPFSRVYLGAHWFTDVLAGFFVGLLCLIGLAQWYASDNDDPHVAPSQLSSK